MSKSEQKNGQPDVYFPAFLEIFFCLLHFYTSHPNEYAQNLKAIEDMHSELWNNFFRSPNASANKLYVSTAHPEFYTLLKEAFDARDTHIVRHSLIEESPHALLGNDAQ